MKGKLRRHFGVCAAALLCAALACPMFAWATGDSITLESVTFSALSGNVRPDKDYEYDTFTTGTETKTRDILKNVLYLPASADVSAIQYCLNIEGATIASEFDGDANASSSTEYGAATAANAEPSKAGDAPEAALSDANQPEANLAFDVSSADESSALETASIAVPATEEAARILEEGTPSSDGVSWAWNGESIPLGDLLSDEAIDTESPVDGSIEDDASAELAAKQHVVAAKLTDATQGVLDLSAEATNVDSDGVAYWLVEFTAASTAPELTSNPVYVYVYQSASVPSMYIHTSKGKSFVEESKENRDKDCSLTMVNPDGSAIVYSYKDESFQDETAAKDENGVELKTRGNSTWAYEKKPFQIKLPKKSELVAGAGKAKTWILLANFIDQSNIRNMLSYDLARGMGLEYSVQGAPVDLYIDGAYQGSYYLCEKVQVNGERVDITDLEDANADANPDVDVDKAKPRVLTSTAGTSFSAAQEVSYVKMNDPADVTGGYLIELELPARYQNERSYVVTREGTRVIFKSPESASPGEVAYMANFLADFEEALYSSDGKNSKGRSYDEYIDLESFARYYVVQEMIGNYDGFATSACFYKDVDEDGAIGKLYAGPTWDCDNTMGAVKTALTLDSADELYVGNAVRGTTIVRWITQLRSFPAFDKLVAKCYKAGMMPLVNALLEGGIDDYQALVGASTALDNLRWSAVKKGGGLPSSVTDKSKPAQSVETVRAFLAKRSKALLESPEFGAYEERSGSATIMRLAGADRYSTNETVVKRAFKNKADVAILASGQNFPDALAASALAGVKDAPIIITPTDSLSDSALKQIKRLGVGSLIICGGEAAVSRSVEKSVKSNVPGIKVTRLAGDTRIQTAIKIYEKGKGSWDDTCVVASGYSFADALAISPYAFASKAPIFLTNDSGTLDAEVEQAIVFGDFAHIIIVGGTAVVASSAEQSLSKLGFNVRRLSGEDRYQTSSAIAKWSSAHGLGTSSITLATGSNFPDAISSSCLCGSLGSPLLLVDPGTSGQYALNDYMKPVRTRIETCIILGGENAVPASIEERVGNLLK